MLLLLVLFSLQFLESNQSSHKQTPLTLTSTRNWKANKQPLPLKQTYRRMFACNCKPHFHPTCEAFVSNTPSPNCLLGNSHPFPVWPCQGHQTFDTRKPLYPISCLARSLFGGVIFSGCPFLVAFNCSKKKSHHLVGSAKNRRATHLFSAEVATKVAPGRPDHALGSGCSGTSRGWRLDLCPSCKDVRNTDP